MKETMEAEQCVIGACMMQQEAVAATVERLTPDEFFYSSNRKIYEAIFAIFTRGEVVDNFSVHTQLRANKTLDEVGGVGYMMHCVEQCPSAANIEVYVRAVEAGSAVRKVEASIFALQAAIEGGATLDVIAQSVEELVAIPQRTTAKQTNRFTLSRLSDLRNQPLKPFIVDGILPAHALAAIVGLYGSYKSFVALDISLSIATGLPWQGNPVQRGYAVYVAAEGAGAEINKRADAWCARHHVTDLETFRVITDAPQISNHADVSALIRAFASLPESPQLVVLDTLARCMVGGDENSARDMGLFVAGLDRLRRETGATIALVHHIGKGGDMRGSSALPGAMDTILEVRARDRLATISCGKQKDMAAFEPLTVVGRIVGDGLKSSLVFEQSDAAPVGVTLPQRAVTTLAILREQFPDGANFTDWKAAAAKVEINHGAFVRSKDELLKMKQVIHDGKTKLYRAAPEIEENGDLSVK